MYIFDMLRYLQFHELHTASVSIRHYRFATVYSYYITHALQCNVIFK